MYCTLIFTMVRLKGLKEMRRLYGFLVAGEVLGVFFRNGNRSFKVTGPVPESASFWSAYFDHSRNAFVVVFEDESFPPVAGGEEIPIGAGPDIHLDNEARTVGESSRCEWEWDETHDKWDSECGNSFQFITGTPTENEMQFCPYCGKQISEYLFQEDDDPRSMGWVGDDGLP